MSTSCSPATSASLDWFLYSCPLRRQNKISILEMKVLLSLLSLVSVVTCIGSTGLEKRLTALEKQVEAMSLRDDGVTQQTPHVASGPDDNQFTPDMGNFCSNTLGCAGCTQCWQAGQTSGDCAQCMTGVCAGCQKEYECTKGSDCCKAKLKCFGGGGWPNVNCGPANACDVDWYAENKCYPTSFWNLPSNFKTTDWWGQPSDFPKWHSCRRDKRWCVGAPKGVCIQANVP